jgi:hypothetical protein
LIDEDDVSRSLDLMEDCPDLTRELRGSLTGAAGKKEEGIVAGCRRQGRQHDNPKADLTSNNSVTVFEDRHRPA